MNETKPAPIPRRAPKPTNKRAFNLYLNAEAVHAADAVATKRYGLCLSEFVNAVLWKEAKSKHGLLPLNSRALRVLTR